MSKWIKCTDRPNIVPYDVPIVVHCQGDCDPSFHIAILREDCESHPEERSDAWEYEGNCNGGFSYCFIIPEVVFDAKKGWTLEQ